jgi:predicted porin
MQKGYSFLALAGFIVIASPVDAETVIYGRLHTNQASPDSGEDQGPRFRLKNPEELGSGLRALFEVEWQVDSGRLTENSKQPTAGHRSYLERDLGTTSGGNAVEAWDLSIDYRSGKHTIGTSLSNYREHGLENRQLWGAATRYRYSDFSLTARYEYDPDPEALDQSHEWMLVGEYFLGDNVLHARYSNRDWDEDTDPNWAFGLTHQLNERTSFYAEFQDNDSNSEQLYGAGFRHDF